MIEELKILQTIIGDLSGLGGWLVAAFLIYKVLFLAVAAYTLHFIVVTLASHFKAGITRAEAARIEVGNTQLIASHEAEKTRLNSEMERIKHMYKILKESRADDITPKHT